MARKTGMLALALGGLIGAGAAVGYVRYLRPRLLTWGALPEETFLEYPGDELVAVPKMETTHAINIFAPAYRIWPWLVQMGQGRGGFYTYDWLENLGGLNIHSADRVLAMYQDLRVGDTVPFTPDGFGMRVVRMDENRALVLHGDTRTDPSPTAGARPPGDFFAGSWGFYLYEVGDGVTRVVQRLRLDWTPSLKSTLATRLFLEPASSIMAHGMLEGIRDRAEGRVVWETAGADKTRPDSAAGLELGQQAETQRQPGEQYAGNTQPNPNPADPNPGAQTPDNRV